MKTSFSVKKIKDYNRTYLVTFETVWFVTTTTFFETLTSNVGLTVTATVGGTVGVAVTVLMIATPCWFSTYVGTAVTAGAGAGNV